MPIDYEIDESRALVRTTASGALTDDDILQLKARLLADPRWRAGMKELSNVQAIERLDVTPKGVKAMVSADAMSGVVAEGYRLAIVAPQDSVYGMARMYQMLSQSSSPNINVFRDLASAEAWLGIEATGAPRSH